MSLPQKRTKMTPRLLAWLTNCGIVRGSLTFLEAEKIGRVIALVRDGKVKGRRSVGKSG